MMMKHFKILSITVLLAIFSIACHTNVYAQGSDYKFHTVFIYNFTKYIKWPASSQNGDFVIGILGNSPIIPELERMANVKKVGNQNIVVKKFNNAASISNCQILFIPSVESNSLKDVKNVLKNKPTLVITERVGMAQKGSAINFVLQGGRWRFELNKATTDAAGLKVADQLSRLAILVE